MTSKGEKIGSALAKAVKKTAANFKSAGEELAAGMKEGMSPEDGKSMYRTNRKNVPMVEGLKRKDGWVDMQVQFLIDKKSAGCDHVVGWTVLKPGARHERHLHRNCDEFFIVLKGRGHIYSDVGEEPSVEGDWSIRRAAAGTVSTTPPTKTWCWSGAGWTRARSRPPAMKCRRKGIDCGPFEYSQIDRPPPI